MIYFREKQTIAGNYTEVDITVRRSVASHRGKRAKRSHRSRKAQANLNEKNARRKLLRLINANFIENDWFVTLTYGEDVSEKRAAACFRSYIDRLRTAHRKVGEEPRYIYVTEYSPKHKLHHHMMLGASAAVSKDIIKSKWKHGYSDVRHIHEHKNGFEELAGYMLKNPNGKRRFNHSLNLKKPVEKIDDKKYTGG